MTVITEHALWDIEESYLTKMLSDIFFIIAPQEDPSNLITLIGSASWALISVVIASILNLQLPFALIVFSIMTLVAWILIPLYIKKIKPAFMLGIILLIFGLIELVASPGNSPWHTFTNPISIVSYLVLKHRGFLLQRQTRSP